MMWCQVHTFHGIFFSMLSFNKNRSKHTQSLNCVCPCVRVFPLLNQFTEFYGIAVKVMHLEATSTRNTEFDTEANYGRLTNL